MNVCAKNEGEVEKVLKKQIISGDPLSWLLCFLAWGITSTVGCSDQLILFDNRDDDLENLMKGLMVKFTFSLSNIRRNPKISNYSGHVTSNDMRKWASLGEQFYLFWVISWKNFSKYCVLSLKTFRTFWSTLCYEGPEPSEWVNDIISQWCRSWSPFQRTAFDMWHSCVGLLFQILHFSYAVYNLCIRLLVKLQFS
jgi:hypothetical protein